MSLTLTEPAIRVIVRLACQSTSSRNTCSSGPKQPPTGTVRCDRDQQAVIVERQGARALEDVAEIANSCVDGDAQAVVQRPHRRVVGDVGRVRGRVTSFDSTTLGYPPNMLGRAERDRIIEFGTGLQTSAPLPT